MEILKVENLVKEVDGKRVLNKISFTVLKGDKICFIAQDDMVKTTLFNILSGKEKYDKGTIEWGKTIIPEYLPQDNKLSLRESLSQSPELQSAHRYHSSRWHWPL